MCETTGMHYKGVFWEGYDYEGISSEEIEEKVQDFLTIIERSKVVLNDERQDIQLCQFIDKDGKIAFLTALHNNQYIVNIIEMDSQLEDYAKNKIKSELWSGNIYDKSIERKLLASGIMELYVEPMDVFIINGILKSDFGKKYNLEMTISEDLMGAGNSTIEVKENKALLNGELGTITYKQIKHLKEQFPEVNKIVFNDVPGSVNDDVNMHTGRLIREFGYTTIATEKSKIFSGGVDLFCSGKERIITNGAILGVHCWDDGEDKSAKDYPKDHPIHRFQINYFSEMLSSEFGEEFYFFTLNSAESDDIHNMTLKELKTYRIGTHFN